MPQSFTHLTPQLWVAQSELFHTNSGIWIGGHEAVLVDPGIYPQEIAAIARFLADRSVTPRVIVLTHSHWDHILGPEAFPGVRTIAHAQYRPIVREHGAEILREIDDWVTQQHVQRDRPFVIPEPDETFETTTTLTVGDLTLHLTHAPGHAPNQLTAYHTETGALWAADMLSDLEIPFAASLTAYRRTLADLAVRDIRVLVPGHGRATSDPVEIGTRLDEDRAYLDELSMRVAEAVRQGWTVEETVAACASMRFRHPADNAGPHRWNVESAYLEAGGPGDPRTLGWTQDWSTA